jgi:hypothetical protein
VDVDVHVDVHVHAGGDVYATGPGCAPCAPCPPLVAGRGLAYDGAVAQIIDNDKRAQQKARAIASDIFLYNKAKIEEAIVSDTFFDDDDLSALITEGRDLFRSAVTPEMFKKNYYDRAIVDRVIKPMGALKSKIW